MKELQNILTWKRTFSIGEFDTVMKLVRKNFRFTKAYNHVKYFNVPCAFDIETSSIYNDAGEKTAIMYAWTFGIYGAVFIGRTWDEFLDLCMMLVNTLCLNPQKRLMIYVHNLAFDFAFFRKWFDWKKVFAIRERTPVYALAENGLEFRCSYILSGYGLEKVGEHLQNYSVRKMVGDLDYDLIRHSQTPLTEKELGYIANDARVVMAYIGECIDEEGGVNRIPLTKTGYVRRYCKAMCFYGGGEDQDESIRMMYRRTLATLTLTSEEYFQMKRAFQGGFTHGNAFQSNKVIQDITSYDFTSSYPTVMIAEKFPMGPGELIDRPMKRSEFFKYLREYCCVFEIELYNVRPKVMYEFFLSRSRCREVERPQTHNGRIVRADHLKTTITNVDYMILRKFYTWDKPERISNFRRYHKGYLPTDFVKAILKLYKDKTQLKDVAGKEAEYNKAKEMLNSCYGMTVTDIVRDEIDYEDNLWPEEGPRHGEERDPLDVEKQIEKYNKNRGRFLFYGWGLFVTAYARRNLFSGIMEFNTDYVYSDTDSVKVRNAQAHQAYIDDYNNRIRMKLYKAMAYHNLSCDEVEPTNIKGEKKPLGIWSFDGHYESAKFCRAKCYMVKYSHDPRNKEGIRGKYMLTVSGLNKREALPYLLNQGDPYEYFGEGMIIPAGQTGKKTHTHIDDERIGQVTDYLGNTAHYHELSGIHLSSAAYKMKFSEDLVQFLLNIQTD